MMMSTHESIPPVEKNEAFSFGGCGSLAWSQNIAPNKEKETKK
jgi:hypothetical protein